MTGESERVIFSRKLAFSSDIKYALEMTLMKLSGEREKSRDIKSAPEMTLMKLSEQRKKPVTLNRPQK